MKLRFLAALGVIVGILALPGAAFATGPYDTAAATTDITTWLGNVADAIGPLFLVIASGLLGLVVISWGIRKVLRFAMSHAH